MAGMASQTNYEQELLATYLRSGRVSPIAKRDVELALSIYRMPTKTGRALTYDRAKASAKALGTDSALMGWAAAAVLNKAKADRAAKTAAAPRIVSGATMAARRAAAALPPAAPRIVSGATMAARTAGYSAPAPSRVVSGATLTRRRSASGGVRLI